jgi:hypothetical protein
VITMMNEDPTAEEINDWLDSWDPDDPNVRVYNMERFTAAARSLRAACAELHEQGLSWLHIGMPLDLSAEDTERAFGGQKGTAP